MIRTMWSWLTHDPQADMHDRLEAAIDSHFARERLVFVLIKLDLIPTRRR